MLLLNFVPDVFAKVFAIVSSESLSPEDMKHVITTLILLLFNVGPQYYIANKHKSQDIIDLVILQRFLLVPTIVLSILINSDPIVYSLSRFLFLIDVVSIFPMLYFSPDGFLGWCDRIFHKHCGIQQAEGIEIYTAFSCSALATVITLVMYNNVMAAFQVQIGIFLSWNSQWGLYVTGLDSYRKKLLIISIIGSLCVSEGLQVISVPLRINVLILGAGLIGSTYSFATAAASFVYMGFKLFFYLGTVENGLFYMMIGWGVALISVSFAWAIFCWESYDADQQTLAKRIHIQDWTMIIFIFGAAMVMSRLDILKEGEVGYWPSLVLSFSTFMFTVQTKNLIHRKVGAPHHPSWWVDGIFPMQDPINDLVNVSFSITTTIATLGNVIICIYLGYVAIGFEEMAINSPNLWKFLVLHGISIIGHSGFWMIFATTGVPANGWTKIALATSPPGYTKGPILYVDPKNALKPHKFDIFTGVGLLFIGAFCVQSELSPRDDYLLRIFTVFLWSISIPWKIWVHYTDYGYTPAIKPHPNESFAKGVYPYENYKKEKELKTQ